MKANYQKTQLVKKLKPLKLANALRKYFLECKCCKTMIYQNHSKYLQFGPERQIKINQIAHVFLQIEQVKNNKQVFGSYTQNPSSNIQSQNKLFVFCQTCADYGKKTLLGEVFAKPSVFSSKIQFIFQKNEQNSIQTKFVTGYKFKSQSKCKKNVTSIDNIQNLVINYAPLNIKRVKKQLVRILLFWHRYIVSKILQIQRKIRLRPISITKLIQFKKFYQSSNLAKIKKRKRQSLNSMAGLQHKQLQKEI